MAEKLTVLGARGPGLTEIARKTGNFGVAPTDSDTQALTKFADAAIQQNPGFKGDPGPTGASDNTYTSLATFKASDIGRKTASLVGIPGVPDGRFNWTLGNYTGQADDVNIIKADSTALSVGAWVRQKAEGVSFRLPGAGTSPATVASKLAARIDIEDLGAIGDGSTNNTAIVNANLIARFNRLQNTQTPYEVEIHGRPGARYKMNLELRQNGLRFIGNGAEWIADGDFCANFTQDETSNDNQRGAIINWKMMGAAQAAVKGRASNFILVQGNRITGCNRGIDIVAVEAKIIRNHVRYNTGTGILIQTDYLVGGGVGESQRCIITDNESWDNGGYGLHFANGVGHHIAGNDSEVNALGEYRLQATLACTLISSYGEPNPSGAPFFIQIDNSPGIAVGRTADANQIIGGFSGGGAAIDIKNDNAANTTIAFMRLGGGTITNTAGSSGLKLGFMAGPYTLTDAGNGTIDMDAMLSMGSLRAHAGQGVYIGPDLLLSGLGGSIANPTGGTTVDAEARAAIVSILARMRAKTPSIAT